MPIIVCPENYSKYALSSLGNILMELQGIEIREMAYIG
jgi:hypothetical protein